MAKRRQACAEYRCDEPVHASGALCQRHSEEAERNLHRFMEASNVLHTSRIDGEYIGPGPLRDELHRIQDWWRQVCAAGKAGREHPVLKDETRFGGDWCIAIAQEIIDAERDRRTGKPGDTELRKYLRDETWKRFENLERGLMSNGVTRPGGCC